MSAWRQVLSPLPQLPTVCLAARSARREALSSTTTRLAFTQPIHRCTRCKGSLRASCQVTKHFPSQWSTRIMSPAPSMTIGCQDRWVARSLTFGISQPVSGGWSMNSVCAWPCVHPDVTLANLCAQQPPLHLMVSGSAGRDKTAVSKPPAAQISRAPEGKPLSECCVEVSYRVMLSAVPCTSFVFVPPWNFQREYATLDVTCVPML